MSDASTNGHPACKTGLGSVETWAIVAVILAAGIALGLPIGAKLERVDAEERVTSIRTAYAASLNSKDESIRMCLGRATEASEAAAAAAGKAEQAAGAAQQAIEKATELPK